MIITDKHFELVGWFGFILIVSAYLLITIKYLDISSAIYHLMNLAGALSMVVNAKHNQALPLFWLNMIWALIAVLGLLQLV
jgi:hypothetical protein